MPTIDEVIDDLLGGERPQWGRIAASFLGTAQAVQSSVSDQVLQWGALLVRNATVRWAKLAVKNVFCAAQDCDAQALVACAACGSAFCLAHSLLSHHAEGICERCALELVKIKRADWKPPPPPSARGSAGRAAAAPKRDDVAAAFKSLGLPKTATWDEIKAKYKKLCVKHNADKPQSAVARAKNTEKLKEINVAYATLRTRHEKVAA